MRSGGGKSKGSAFERKVCKDLSLWISRGERQDVFWRSAMSGGRSTVALKSGAKLGAQAGDISAIDELGNAFIKKFMVECKAYADLDWEGCFKGTGKFLKFWSRALADGITYGKAPLLVGKQNNFPILVGTHSGGFESLGMIVPMAWIPAVDLWLIYYDDLLRQDPTKVALGKRSRIKL